MEMPAQVAEKYNEYPEAVANALLHLRALIFEVAADLPQTGGLVETLKWGEPSYLPKKRNVGTTVRLGQSNFKDYALYVSCQTKLISSFRLMSPNEFYYEGNRGVHFSFDTRLDENLLGLFVTQAFTYHQR
ncbi:DUF1801 domain-containing protein [Maritalea sp. S77]|uniref:DUF1801 domain-containing protein n=1 Tax=Maritalea sp. S77 TaxID=3415125 RepID=UPI003C7C1A64